MKPVKNTSALLIVLFLLFPPVLNAGFLWWKSKDDDNKSADKKSSISTEKYKPTYLDSLNKGNEIYLKNLGEFQKAGIIEGFERKNLNKIEADEGFRVQCAASRSIDAARNKKNELMKQFSYPVYISFDEPYYRIRVGNFRDRDGAEKAVKLLRNKGYSDAWIVSPEKKKDN